MPVYCLENSCYRGQAINTPPAADGKSAFTWPALIEVDRGTPPIRTFCKIYPEEPARKDLVNELIGYLGLEAFELSTPKRAGFIEIGVDQIPKNTPEWVNRNQSQVAWWTEAVDGPSLKGRFKVDDNIDPSLCAHRMAKARSTLLGRRDFIAKVIVADDVLANIDRNLGNLIAHTGGYVLIDNGACLTGPIWNASTLNASGLYYNIIKEFLEPEIRSLDFSRSMIKAKVDMSAKLAPLITEVNKWLFIVDNEDDRSAIIPFISERLNGAGMNKRLGFVL